MCGAHAISAGPLTLLLGEDQAEVNILCAPVRVHRPLVGHRVPTSISNLTGNCGGQLIAYRGTTR